MRLASEAATSASASVAERSAAAIARADDEVGGDGARLRDAVASGAYAARARFARGGDDERVRPRPSVSASGRPASVGIGAAGGGDG